VVVVVEVVAVKVLVEIWRVDEQHGMATGILDQRGEVDVGDPGWEVVAVYQDEGISGTKGRDHRPQFDAMLKAATRRKFDMIAA
jgi:hypothetical protein